MYFLAAMWVHSAHRGKGVGTELVRAALEWAQTNVDPKFPDRNEEREKVVILLVYENNASARALYSKVGFRDLVGVPSEDGEQWMSVKI
jgi:GNAT superfamily N-acetyltransferase